MALDKKRITLQYISQFLRMKWLLLISYIHMNTNMHCMYMHLKYRIQIQYIGHQHHNQDLHN